MSWWHFCVQAAKQEDAEEVPEEEEDIEAIIAEEFPVRYSAVLVYIVTSVGCLIIWL